MRTGYTITVAGASLARRRPDPYYDDMCSYCGQAMPVDRKPGFNEVCESCGKDLHACLNCRFYKPGLRWDCAETIQEGVADKEARNHCDWYQTNPAYLVATSGRTSQRGSAEKARRDLGKLFGD